MTADLAALVNAVFPYATAAISAYGGAVLARVQDDAADATVGWGKKILQRVFGIKMANEGIPETITDLAEKPEDIDLQAALRVQIRRTLANNPELAAEVAHMVEQAQGQSVLGQGQVIAHASGNAQQANLGQGAMNVSFGRQRDQGADR